MQDAGGTSQVTSGVGNSVQTGYGRLVPEAGNTTPTGMAIFGYRRDGVLISETSVPVSRLLYDGRIPAEINGIVNTGLAISNPNTEAAILNFYFSDGVGDKLYGGIAAIPPGGLVSAFLNETPFVPLTALKIDLSQVRSFTFSSSLPIGVTAIRGLINERSDFLVTALPVIELGNADNAPLVFAHFADGGGWTTRVLLVNPMETSIAGVAEFYSGGSHQDVPYGIPPRATAIVQAPRSGDGVRSGWIRVKPSATMSSPVGLMLFSYELNGITVTEAGMSPVSEGPAFRLFAEGSGNFNAAEPGSVHSGLAISNSDEHAVTVALELFAMDGSATGLRSTLPIPGYGQVSKFLNQLPGFGGLPSSFRGFLKITGAAVGVVGLRGRYNERGDFLIATTPPTSDSALPSTAESVVPYFVDGGGYSTQFILLNSRSGETSNGRLSFVGPTGHTLPLNLK